MATWDLRNGHVDHNDVGPAAVGNPQTNLRIIGTVTSTTGAAGAPESAVAVAFTNPQAFGALGDGVTDDTAAIQRAATAAGPTGVILFPSGTYRIAQNTTVASKLIFEGNASLSVDSGKVFTAGNRVISLGGDPEVGLGTISYGNQVNIFANDLGFAVGDTPSTNTDDFIHFSRPVNSSSGINLWNRSTGSAAQAYMHWFTQDGAALRISCSSLAGGSLANIVFETNLAASLIQQSNAPMDFYTGNVRQLQIGSVPTAVNYWIIKGGAAASSISTVPNGTDANISVIHDTKGTGSHFFRTGVAASFQVEVKDSPAATNRITLTGSNAGNPTLGVSGGSLNIANGIGQGGAGAKHARTSTGSIGATSDALVTVTWTNAFADANYTATATVLDSTASNASLKVVHIESTAAASMTVRVRNDSAGALTGTLHAIAFHD